jgi:hypothetical protein
LIGLPCPLISSTFDRGAWLRFGITELSVEPWLSSSYH